MNKDYILFKDTVQMGWLFLSAGQSCDKPLKLISINYMFAWKFTIVIEIWQKVKLKSKYILLL